MRPTIGLLAFMLCAETAAAQTSAPPVDGVVTHVMRCAYKIDDLAVHARQLVVEGAERLAPALADPYLRSQPGEAYGIKLPKGAVLVVALDKSGVCTVTSPQAPADAVEEVLRSGFPGDVELHQLSVERDGGNTLKMFGARILGKVVLVSMLSPGDGVLVRIRPFKPPAGAK